MRREIPPRVKEYLQSPAIKQDLAEAKEETFPLPDEPFCASWQAYSEEAKEKALYPILQKHLVQLQFSVNKGMSNTEAYRKAVRQGCFTFREDEAGLELQAPEKLKLYFYPTPAGRLPVLYTDVRGDFELLAQALSAQNEPVFIPPSMGAMLITGYNNWDRVEEVRRKQALESLLPSLDAKPDRKYHTCAKEYQDCFMILSAGDYSGVSAEKLGISAGEWRKLSLIIREEHEAAHYFTRRVLGFMQNHIFDELLADFMGIVRARGKYDPLWQLLFLGLEDYPHYRSGARLENYVRAKDFSGVEFAALQNQVLRAVERLDAFYHNSCSAVTSPAEKGELLLDLLKFAEKALFTL